MKKFVLTRHQPLEPEHSVINPLAVAQQRRGAISSKPEVPSLSEWMTLTKLRWSKRGDGMKKLDKAFSDYLAGNQANPRAMLTALDEYLAHKGGDWSRVDRNVASRGLLERLHTQLRQSLNLPPTASDAGVTAVRRVLVPESRFGFLYLMGQTTIDLNGVGLMGSWIAAQAQLAQAQVFAIQGANHVVGSIGSRELTSVGIAGMVSGPMAMGEAGMRALASRQVASASAHTHVVHTAPLRRQNTINRLPVNSRDLGSADSWLAKLTAQYRRLGSAAMEMLRKIRGALEKAGRYIAQFYSSHESLILKSLHHIVRFVLCNVLEKAVPFIGEAIKLGSALVQTVDKAITGVQLWAERRLFRFGEMSSEMMAMAVEHQLKLGMGEGLFEALKNAGTLTTNVFAPGLGIVVNALVNGVKWMAVAIKRIVEQSKIDDFLREMRAIWQKETAIHQRDEHGRIHVNLQQDCGSLIHRPDDYHRVFEKGCKASPLIPLIALNSGICGNAWTHLKLTKDTLEGIISQNEFDAGTHYFTRIKGMARDYLRESDFKFRSDNRTVQGYLNHAINSHELPMTNRRRVVALLAG
jgi:hypothetical protein